MRETKAESSARELRVLQLLLIDGFQGLTHDALKFAAVAATGKEVDQDLGRIHFQDPGRVGEVTKLSVVSK